MTSPSTILHDMELLPSSRRLVRNSQPPAIAETTVATAQPSLSPTAPTVSTFPSATPQDIPVKPVDSNAYSNGYEEGYRAAKKEVDQEVRRLAEQMAENLAADLAHERVQQAFARATEEAKKQADQLAKPLQDQLQSKLTRLNSLLEQIPVQFDAYLANAEDDMLALVYEVVCKLMGEEGASLPGLRAQLQQCLKAWHGHAMLNIELHPDDLALLQSDEDSLKLLKGGGFSAERNTLRWVADSKVKVGGLRLRSSEGILDARLEVQFKALETALLNTRASRKHLASMERPA